MPRKIGAFFESEYKELYAEVLNRWHEEKYKHL